MQNQNISATRMELKRVRQKLKSAETGYKLLKDKTNELIRKFTDSVRELKTLRKNVDEKLKSCLYQFGSGASKFSDNELALMFAVPTSSVESQFESVVNFGIEIPKIILTNTDVLNELPYSPIDSNSQLDFAVQNFNKLFLELIELSGIEKKVYLYADEIEKNKRRVNALENILLPKYKKQMTDIELKLGENERATTARLMKVRNIIENKE